MVEGAVQPPGNGFEATRRKIRKLNLDAYLLLLPALALAVGIYLYPIIQLLQFSLYRVVNIDNMRYVGLTNFARLLRNDEFPIALTEQSEIAIGGPSSVDWGSVPGHHVDRADAGMAHLPCAPVLALRATCSGCGHRI